MLRLAGAYLLFVITELNMFIFCLRSLVSCGRREMSLTIKFSITRFRWKWEYQSDILIA